MGLIENQNCAKHEDCAAGSYCRISINWPFRSLCSKQKGTYEACTSDFHCQNNMYCWFASSDDRINNQSKCLPLYSQPTGAVFGWRQVSGTDTSKIILADYEINGKYCQSGLAYPINDTAAKCATMTSMMYGGKALDEPFPCNPALIN